MNINVIITQSNCLIIALAGLTGWLALMEAETRRKVRRGSEVSDPA